MGDKRQFTVIESRQMDHLRVFHDVARALTQTLELEDILRIIMEKMAQFFGPERWSMLMVDEHAAHLYYVIAVGENAESLRGLSVPLGEGVAGWVAATGNALVVPNVSLDAKWSAFSRAHPELNIQSIACIPISARGKTLGVIQLLNSKLDLMSEYSNSFLRILCDYAAIAIENADSVERIHQLTITDDCTGLYNARHLYTMLDEQVGLSAVNRVHQFSLLFVDLDHFKQVNDTHGHLIGSRLLAEVGSLMKRVLGPENAAFRYGGDEFVALLPGLGKQAAIDATMRLWQQLREARFLSGAGLSLSLAGSFGLATYPEDGNSVQAIIRSADTQMYAAKTTRDNVSVTGLGLVATTPGMQPPKGQSATMAGAELATRRRIANA
ncbi:MAG TPA: sensor domain-containing diguanylate cyclase [Acidobacteriaceae bacterium]|nr:sensor domain-containing diguanylate cyclase [Acidobacteriaceae bacterium]